MGEFLSEINWSPLWISLKTGVAATIFAFFLGVFCARKIMKLKPGARAVLDGILTMPLVLPPTVPLTDIRVQRSFGSALEWGSRGREFDSRHSDQTKIIRTCFRQEMGSDYLFSSENQRLRSNESPCGAFKRRNGLRQQMEGLCPDKFHAGVRGR